MLVTVRSVATGLQKKLFRVVGFAVQGSMVSGITV